MSSASSCRDVTRSVNICGWKRTSQFMTTKPSYSRGRAIQARSLACGENDSSHSLSSPLGGLRCRSHTPPRAHDLGCLGDVDLPLIPFHSECQKGRRVHG